MRKKLADNLLRQTIHYRLRNDPNFAVEMYDILADDCDRMVEALVDAKKGLMLWRMDYSYIDHALGIEHVPPDYGTPQEGSHNCGPQTQEMANVVLERLKRRNGQTSGQTTHKGQPTS